MVSTYEIQIVLTDDLENLTFMTDYYLDINKAYLNYLHLLSQLGKEFSVIELIQTNDYDLVRILDRVTSHHDTIAKTLGVILKDLEMPQSQGDTKKEIQRMRDNTRKLLAFNPSTQDKRERLCKILKNMEGC